MRISIELEPRGVLRVEQELDRAAKNAADLRPAWQEVSDLLSGEFEQLFARQGAHGGPAWSRLAPRTVASRVRRRLVPIMVGWARGRMATSLIEPTNPYALEVRRPLEYMRGTSAGNKGVSYPSVFEHGRAGRQTARPIIGRLLGPGNAQLTTRIEAAIMKHILPAP